MLDEKWSSWLEFNRRPLTLNDSLAGHFKELRPRKARPLIGQTGRR